MTESAATSKRHGDFTVRYEYSDQADRLLPALFFHLPC